MQYSKSVSVISPLSLRNSIHSTLKSVLDKYENLEYDKEEIIPKPDIYKLVKDVLYEFGNVRNKDSYNMEQVSDFLTKNIKFNLLNNYSILTDNNSIVISSLLIALLINP